MFDRLIRRLHRRQILIHLAEHLGGALFVACGIALVALPIGWIFGQSLVALIAVMLLVGGAMGLAIAVHRRPRAITAAIAVDDQLRLSDLMSSSYWVRAAAKRQADPWSAALLALADAKSADISSSGIQFGTWPARRWGSLALFLALEAVVAIGLPPRVGRSNAPMVQAIDGSNPLLAPPTVAAVSAPLSPVSIRSQVRPPATDDTSAEKTDLQVSIPRSADKSDTSSAAKPNTERASASDPDGSGAGAGGTLTPAHTAIPLADRATHSTGTGSGSVATGGQADLSAGPSSAGAIAKAGVSGSENKTGPVPPWESATWGNDQEKALSAARGKPAYGPYQDLIREYFAR
jgi:hypothetical protein